jgi:hypothetical protein
MTTSSLLTVTTEVVDALSIGAVGVIRNPIPSKRTDTWPNASTSPALASMRAVEATSAFRESIVISL